MPPLLCFLPLFCVDGDDVAVRKLLEASPYQPQFLQEPVQLGQICVQPDVAEPALCLLPTEAKEVEELLVGLPEIPALHAVEHKPPAGAEHSDCLPENSGDLPAFLQAAVGAHCRKDAAVEGQAPQITADSQGRDAVVPA